MLVFAVLVGGATSANGDKPDRSIRHYGRDSYVIIEDSQSHLPLGVLEWDGIGDRDLIQRAQNHAAMTRQAAEAQSREAQKAGAGEGGKELRAGTAAHHPRASRRGLRAVPAQLRPLA